MYSTLGHTDLPVSRLGLGTAEIGFAYGLGSPTLPSEDEAIDLLRTAVALGVTFFDTANYYGLAEERIGKSGILKYEEVVVCTKCAQFLEKGEYFEKDELEKRIREQIESSRMNLGLDTLPLLLLHGPSKAQMEEGALVELMESLKSEKKIRHWGASTRGEESPLAAIVAGASVVQVAYNIADQRMVPQVFPAAVARGAGVINRSVYLKGVFTGKASQMPDSFGPLKVCVTEADKLAKEMCVSLPELALRFTLSEPAIRTSIVGTAKSMHLQSAVEALARGPLPASIVEKLRALSVSNQDQVDPARWNL